MELRQRVRQSPLYFGKKSPEDPGALSFWLCEGLTKRHVHGKKAQTLEAALVEWKLEGVLQAADVHFMNESSGQVVPLGDDMGKFIADRDVVRICDGPELSKLQEKFATRNREVDAEILASQKPSSSIGAALSKLKRIGATNPTINKFMQKTFDDRTSPRTDEVDPLDKFPDIDPVFENGEAEEIPGLDEAEKPKCDVCEVSWPDDAGTPMYRLKKFGIVAHQGCAQFASDILSRSPEIKSREDFVGMPNVKEANRSGTFHVTVHRAMDLPPAQAGGIAAPYAKLSMLPWKEPLQTKPSENGGRNPGWKNSHDNVMQFSHMYNGSITPIPLLEVDIWNSNYLADEVVACALLDMTPLLRYPHVEVKRWFALSSRSQNPISLIAQSTGQAKVLLSIRFVPTDGNYATGNEHRFRVHQLKSVGLAIPNCAICDRVIVNALKGAWGYRCETCGIDAHKGCIMKAMSERKCKPHSETEQNSSSSKTLGRRSSSSSSRLKHRGITYKLLTDGAPRKTGELFVNFQGLHVCTKQCRPEHDFHAKNIFEGDFYCRLTFDDIVYETSPVLKSADPMFMERVCFKVGRPDSALHLELIDFNTDQCVAEFTTSLYQLQQREADKFVRTNELLNTLREPLQYLSLSDASRQSEKGDFHADIPELSNVEVYSLFASSGASKPSTTGARKPSGYAIINLEYIESKTELLRSRHLEDFTAPSIADREFSVESLRVTFDRLNRAIMTFRWFDAEYARIISWKNKKKSAVVLIVFIYTCLFIDLEYALAYVMLCILAYMVYQLHLRLEGAFTMRWIDYSKYDLDQEDKLKLYRPLAKLHIAVHEARISESTDQLLMESPLLKDVAASKLGYYVRIKFIPNDKKRSRLGGETVFIPSEFEDATVAITSIAEKSRSPTWRKTSLTSGISSVVSKQRKNFSLRNFHESWQHDPATCYCGQCDIYRTKQESKPRALSSDMSDTSDSDMTVCGMDLHAFYFPIPQACRKNFAGIEDVVPWKLYPGVLKFDLCVAVNGEAKESPDVVVGTGYLALRTLLKSNKHGAGGNELLVPLSTTPIQHTEVDDQATGQSFSPSTTASALRLLDEPGNDRLLLRVKFDVPSSRSRELRTLSTREDSDSALQPLVKKTATTSRAERSLSELVMEQFTAEKEKSSVLGGHLLDAFWKVKDTVKKLQIEIESACGIVASTENLLNWTHPWKTAAAFAGVSLAALVFFIIPGRWIVLLFGLTEFGAVFLEDLPPSNHLRKILWNFISSLPTDQDLIDVYEPQRKVFLKQHEGDQEKEEAELLRLRHNGLWAGSLQSKAEGDRHYKTYYVVYRPFRFLLWKNAEDAEAGSQASSILLFDRSSAVIDTSDDTAYKFQVRGMLSTGSEETRVFSLESAAKLYDLLHAVRQSFTS